MINVIHNFYWFLKHLIHFKGDPIVSKTIKNDRYLLCSNCPKLNKKGFLVWLKGPRCCLCGCFIEYKVRYKFEFCPDNPPKWNSEERSTF